MGELVAAVGKAAARHLKSLIGPWWVAHFDPHPDVAAAAKASFQACLPGKKMLEGLTYCLQDLVKFIVTNATITPELLGDAK